MAALVGVAMSTLRPSIAARFIAFHCMLGSLPSERPRAPCSAFGTAAPRQHMPPRRRLEPIRIQPGVPAPRSQSGGRGRCIRRRIGALREVQSHRESGGLRRVW